MTRYFPELVEAVRANLPERCVVDGEIVIPAGGARLDFEALLQRMHPAASRVRLLAEQTPASFVAFDLLALGDEDSPARPFAERRRGAGGGARRREAAGPPHADDHRQALAAAVVRRVRGRRPGRRSSPSRWTARTSRTSG